MTSEDPPEGGPPSGSGDRKRRRRRRPRNERSDRPAGQARPEGAPQPQAARQGAPQGERTRGGGEGERNRGGGGGQNRNRHERRDRPQGQRPGQQQQRPAQPREPRPAPPLERYEPVEREISEPTPVEVPMVLLPADRELPQLRGDYWFEENQKIDVTEARPSTAGQLLLVAGIQFHPRGIIHSYEATEQLAVGDWVVADADAGPMLAQVVVAVRRAVSPDPLRKIIRRATREDQEKLQQLTSKESEILKFSTERIRQKKLPMKPVRVELPVGQGRGLFFFVSEDRVDFRELVRDLSARFHMRIEMRQIGARDGAKTIGGIGSCGRELCCSTWLPAFVPISIKMAKDQGLPLTPSKVTGQCGRLKCCLVYEHETYRALRQGLPKTGKRVSTPAGDGKVVEVDVLRQRVRVLFDEGNSETFPANVIVFQQGQPGGGQRTHQGAPTQEPEEE